MSRITFARIWLGIAGLVALAGSAPRYASLAELYRSDAPVTLDRMSFERGETQLVDSRFFPRQRMRRIELSFASQVYRGMECEHRAKVFLPEAEISPAAKGKAAIVLGGNVLEAPDAAHDWIESVVVKLGVPCMVIMNALPAKELGARNAGELMSMGDRTFYETGDAREPGYYAMSRIYAAAATTLENLPEVRARQMITSGSSKGGMSAFIACAGDKRIVGSYPTAYNSANFPEFARLKGERWGWHVKPKETGPAGETALNTLKMFDSPGGQYYRQLFDPVEWGDLLEGKFVMPTVGTNDPLFHLLTDQFYYDELKAKTAILRVPNYGHGREAPRIAVGWRFAVAAALLGRNVPSIRLTTRESDGQVSVLARVTDAGKIKEITLYTANDQTGDYRHAKWQRVEAAHPNNTGDAVTIATLEKPANGTLAAFAELVEEGPRTDSIVSSNVVEIGTPVKHRLE